MEDEEIELLIDMCDIIYNEEENDTEDKDDDFEL